MKYWTFIVLDFDHGQSEVNPPFLLYKDYEEAFTNLKEELECFELSEEEWAIDKWTDLSDETQKKFIFNMDFIQIQLYEVKVNGEHTPL